MDPASAAGLGVGVASLAFDAFDRSIKVFKFFSSIADMPKDCERCRLQLMIEYNRVLAWGDAVGLIEVPSGSHVASSLGTNAVELCDILSRVAWLLEKFKELNDRWKPSTKPDAANTLPLREEEAKKVDLSKQVSNLAAAYEANKERREHLRTTQRLSKWLSGKTAYTKDIVTNPFRVRWVMVDKEAFEAFLDDLHSLTERIHQLMGDYRINKIHETTAKTYREMVIMCNELRDLKNLIKAVARLIEISTNNSTQQIATNTGSQELLRDLLRLKELKFASNELLHNHCADDRLDINTYLAKVITVPRYEGTTLFNRQFTLARSTSTSASVQHRQRGVLSREGIECHVWVEWKTAEIMLSDSMEDKKSTLRTMTLAQMLSLEKPRHLYTPKCLGFIDNRASRDRFGWIFEMPQGSNARTSLKNLHEMLGQNTHKPSLSQRVAVAWKLASSLSYLHTTDWLHKGVHSGNVMFPCDGEITHMERPLLSGFEYSRPQSSKTTSRSLDPRWDIYRWPRVQNDVPKEGTSRKTHDIYSFGLLLIEIAHWQPLHKLLCLKRWPAPSAQDCRVRGWLLGEESMPPFKSENPLSELRNTAGDKYWSATKNCIVAHGECGMRIEENTDQSQTSTIGIQLQDAFNDLVVDKLKSVSI